jgi:hypothetical protein
MTEREFLDQQMDQARQAMSRTTKLLGQNLGKSVDPRRWTQSHPWISLSGAAVAAFALISLLPHRHKKPPPPPPVEKKEKGEPSKRGGLLHGLIGHGLKLSWRWLASVVFSNIASKMGQDDSQQPPADPNDPAARPAETATR